MSCALYLFRSLLLSNFLTIFFETNIKFRITGYKGFLKKFLMITKKLLFYDTKKKKRLFVQRFFFFNSVSV